MLKYAAAGACRKHHLAYIDKPLFRFTPSLFVDLNLDDFQGTVLHEVLAGDDVDGYIDKPLFRFTPSHF
jgi:hypothetical protein